MNIKHVNKFLKLYVAVYLVSLTCTGFCDDSALLHINALLKKHPIIDGHNDLPDVIRHDDIHPRDVIGYDLSKTAPGDTDLARLRRGHIGGQFWSVYIPGTQEVKERGFARIQLEQIDIARRMIEQYPKSLSFALTAKDIEKANKETESMKLSAEE